MITFEQARQLAARETGRDFYAWGYEDADDYMLVADYGTEDFRVIPIGEQPTIVSKATGDVRQLVVIQNFDRIDAMSKIGTHPKSEQHAD